MLIFLQGQISIFIAGLHKSYRSLITMSCGDRYVWFLIGLEIFIELEHAWMRAPNASLPYIRVTWLFAFVCLPQLGQQCLMSGLVFSNFVFLGSPNSQNCYIRLSSLCITEVSLINMASQCWKLLLALLAKLCALVQGLKKKVWVSIPARQYLSLIIYYFAGVTCVFF